MYQWFLPTLSEILVLSRQAEANAGVEPSCVAENQKTQRSNREQPHRLCLIRQRAKAEREWSAAIAALNRLLAQEIAASTGNAAVDHKISDSPSLSQGLVLSGPVPVLSHANLVSHFSAWSFTTEAFNLLDWMPCQLLPAADASASPSTATSALPLIPGDPLSTEQFCLVLTAHFSFVMVLGKDHRGQSAFLFSFEPEVVQWVWQALRPRVLLVSPHQLGTLDALVKQFAPIAPAYRTVMQFSQWLLEYLPEPEERESSKKSVEKTQIKTLENAAYFAAKVVQSNPGWQQMMHYSPAETTVELALDGAEFTNQSAKTKVGQDIELVQAIAHEVRTPLTTIRTLTRSLLKRHNLETNVRKRLEMIDRECTEQIDRFNLIFKAAELETVAGQRSSGHLAPTSLTEVFQNNIPRWQQQASQRQLSLEVVLPQKLPTVVSDPTMLDQALTGLIERFTRSLPAGSHIQVTVMLAGDQLKLQLQHNPSSDSRSRATDTELSPVQDSSPPLLKALGELLMFQPETGRLSLSLAVTKNLFQALGAKLIVRQRPRQGEVLTVFLPLELSSPLETNNPTIYTV